MNDDGDDANVPITSAPSDLAILEPAMVSK